MFVTVLCGSESVISTMCGLGWVIGTLCGSGLGLFRLGSHWSGLESGHNWLCWIGSHDTNPNPNSQGLSQSGWGWGWGWVGFRIGIWIWTKTRFRVSWSMYVGVCSRGLFRGFTQGVCSRSLLLRGLFYYR